MNSRQNDPRTPHSIEIEDLKGKLKLAHEALEALLDLRGGMEKPREHPPTRDALRKAEMALYGYTMTE